MGFKKQLNEEMSRFKEFDEARIYIEEKAQMEDIFDAIDYMIVHKEFYFLLKTLKSNQSLQDKQIIEYLFSRLPCLKRQEDQEMLFSFLECAPNHIKTRVIKYLFECCQHFNIDELTKYIPINDEILYLALEHGECQSVKHFMRYIQTILQKQKLTVEKFFEVYKDE